MEVNHYRLEAGLAKMSLDLTSSGVLIGILIGSILPFLVGATTMTAVGKAAGDIVEEIRRQSTIFAGCGSALPSSKPGISWNCLLISSTISPPTR
jgi:Na+/H+-translocating membrane pyrophosphatase